MVIRAPFAKHPNTRTVYVSSSNGNDAFSGLAPDEPKRTLEAGIALLRNGYPDWLCLHKGDAWDGGLGTWKKTGAGADAPMVITSYGQAGQRPLLRTGPEPGFVCHGSSGTPTKIDGLVISGIHFYANTRDPKNAMFAGSGGSNGLTLLRHASNITIHDCKFESFLNGIVIQDFERKGMSNILISKCVILDSYNTGGHSQGAYISGVTGLKIEDNVFDHNGHGYLPDTVADDPTIFNHNLYLQHDNGLDVEVVRNIFTRAASHGCQLRSGGVFSDNFLYRNPIAFTGGYDTPVPNASIVCERNVVLEGTDISPSLPRGWGLTFRNLTTCKVADNIVMRVATTSSNRRSIEEFDFCSYKGNIVYAWPSDPSKNFGNKFNTNSKEGFLDPDRSIERYCGSQEAFFELIREGTSWRVSAPLINGYLRGGFGPPEAPAPTEDPQVPSEEPLPEAPSDPESHSEESTTEEPKVVWENFSTSSVGDQFLRLKVPGGWLLSVINPNLGATGVEFLPDASHQWSI